LLNRHSSIRVNHQLQAMSIDPIDLDDLSDGDMGNPGHEDSMTRSEFEQAINERSQTITDLQTVVGSWLQQIEPSPYSAHIRDDMEDVAYGLTIALSLIETSSQSQQVKLNTDYKKIIRHIDETIDPVADKLEQLKPIAKSMVEHYTD
jgi:hypothetical protein